MLPVETIALKRDGAVLNRAQINAFVEGLAGGGWSDAQVGAMAMAIVLRGMDRHETVLLTQAMTASGDVLSWAGAGLHGPILDKHSTGGVGDKVSLMLAPIVAACGGVVPMISGRGLGHTGGTLDKLEALPGYNVNPPRELLLKTLREAGCAIFGASARLAPADRRLYAIRDVTATVESVPLITASILSKKLAAGVQGLVLDVKCGSGAFCRTLDEARTLAASLVAVAQVAGLPARALITDMNQVLGHSAGNLLELQETLDYLRGDHRDPRLHEVVLALAAQMLVSGGLAVSADQGRSAAQRALDSGAAAERFARMVALLGGPADVLAAQRWPGAPVQLEVLAPFAGVLAACDTRALGLAVVALGGGRGRPGDPIDPRVGLAHVLPLGSAVVAGQALAIVHAASEDAAAAARRSVLAAIGIAERGAAGARRAAVIIEALTGP